MRCIALILEIIYSLLQLYGKICRCLIHYTSSSEVVSLSMLPFVLVLKIIGLKVGHIHQTKNLFESFCTTFLRNLQFDFVNSHFHYS